MSKTSVSVVQLRGCDRCALHMLAFQDWDEFELIYHSLLEEYGSVDDIKNTEILVLTGYVEEDDRQQLEELEQKASTIVAYGTCPHSGGIFGLANQRGGRIIPLENIIKPHFSFLGCPPSPDIVKKGLKEADQTKLAPLCKSCKRTFQQDSITEITRAGSLQNEEQCFNNLGLPCSGVVSGECAQRCIDFETPCRGCVEAVTTPSAKMIGYFGSLTYPMIDVATIANWWATDKLADETDDLTESLVDIVGTFFRFHLASAFPRGGIAESTGDTYSDIMVGRRVEEAIQIAGTIYGSRGISVALNLIEGYEDAVSLIPTDQVLELRESLRKIQGKWLESNESPSSTQFFEYTNQLCNIAGNEVLSNLFFCGFKVPIESTQHPYETYKAATFEPSTVEGYSEDEFSKVRFKTDEKGIIREWSCEF